MRNPIMKYFEYKHLPENLQRVSAPVCMLAGVLEQLIPDSEEKAAGMRKLLEAKDCFVRAFMSESVKPLNEETK